MSVFIPLLLTHFIADYPLQSGSIIHLKQKSFLGVLLHCSVHLVVMLAVMHGFLYDFRVLWGVLIVFGTHNIIDQIKVTLDKKHPRWRLHFYLADQLAHVAVVTLVAFWLGSLSPVGPFEWVYRNGLIMAYLLVLVLSTYFYDVTRYFLRHRQPDGVEYKRDYRVIVMNGVLVTVVFGGVFLLSYLGLFG